MEARIGLGVNSLDTRRVINVGHGRNFRTRHVELVDAEQRLFFRRHRAPSPFCNIGHQQHVRAVGVELEPIGDVFAQNRRRERTKRFAIFDLRLSADCIEGERASAMMERLPSARGPNSMRP